MRNFPKLLPGVKMNKKPNITRKAKDEISLTREESDELEMVLDRLAVQDPEGESFHGYLQSLGNSLSTRPLLAAALIDRLSRDPGQTGFSAFQSLGKIVEASPYKRSLKQAAYRFSQKGFTVTPTAFVPEKIVLIHDEQRKPAAHLFMVPGTIWIVSTLIPEASIGGYILATAFLEDNFATFNVRIAEGSQKLYREYLQALSIHSMGAKGLEIPLRHSAKLFFDMLGFWTGKDTYAQLERGRDIFSRYHEPDKKPYVYELLPEIEEPENSFSEVNIRELLKDMDLTWLRFSKEELSPWHEKLMNLNSPLLVVPKEVQAERSLEVMQSAAENLCAGEKRYLFRRFFEERAMSFKLLGAEEKARWAWIAACNLAGRSPVGKNPVVSQLLIDSVEFHWPGDFKAAAESEQTPARERRTESGIILP